MRAPLLLLLLGSWLSLASAAELWDQPHAANPILPGYYADPTVLSYEGKHYIYATLEPWGDRTLGCWESEDFKNWTFRELNWPTKEACTSPTSGGANVWAPSVVRSQSGRFHMFVSVGNEIWAGVADHPLGPWRNALGDRPLVAADYNRTYHMIDGDAFVDDDGRAYLYWGSGWNWVNGACFAAELNDALDGFVGEVKIITPTNYFEGPTMLKHDGRYYLTYSNGKTISDSYEVRYAVSDHPLGPFTEGSTSPILVTDHARQIVSPGHHGFYRHERTVYIVYHRHRIPFVEGSAFRQVCIDELHFNGDGTIAPIQATHAGPAFVQDRTAGRRNLALTERGARATASSTAAPETAADHVLDDNYATRWAPSADANGSWLQVDLGRPQPVVGSLLRFEYAWKPYAFTLESSSDGVDWQMQVDRRTSPVQGSPVELEHAATARYWRLVFPEARPSAQVGVLEWEVR